MSQESATTPHSNSEARASNQAESSKYRTKEGNRGFTTNASVYLRHYETAENEEQNKEEEGNNDFDWVKYLKECRERRAEKEAQKLGTEESLSHQADRNFNVEKQNVEGREEWSG